MSSTPSFESIMQDAIKMKQADVAHRQAKFKSLPLFLQHTLYTSDKPEIRRFRYRRNDVTLSERLAESLARKTNGNEHFSKGDIGRALLEYEASIGVFYYVASKKPSWKDKGFDDDDVYVVRDFGGEGSGVAELGHDAATITMGPGDSHLIRDKITRHVATVINNVCNVYLRLEQFHDASQAADEVLSLDDKNTKALYRKAVSITRPATSTFGDLKAALGFVDTGLGVAPRDADLLELRQRLVEQYDRDVKAEHKYKGFLNKSSARLTSDSDGTSDDDDGKLPPSSSSGDGTPWMGQVVQAESVVQRLRSEGNEREADDIEAQLNAAKVHKFFLEWVAPRHFSDVHILVDDVEAVATARDRYRIRSLRSRKMRGALSDEFSQHNARICDALTVDDVAAEALTIGRVDDALAVHDRRQNKQTVLSSLR